jgi:hypothetical protein
MSGIYLIVWPLRKEEEENMGTSYSMLETTRWGYPNITLFESVQCTGLETRRELLRMGHASVEKLLGVTAYLKRAYVVDVFTSDVNRDTQYDLLYELDENFAKKLSEVREGYNFKFCTLPHELQKNMLLPPPVITFGRFTNKREAEAKCAVLNKYLPVEVKICGYTIN